MREIQVKRVTRLNCIDNLCYAYKYRIVDKNSWFQKIFGEPKWRWVIRGQMEIGVDWDMAGNPYEYSLTNLKYKWIQNPLTEQQMAEYLSNLFMED